jgi:hypothetical protein
MQITRLLQRAQAGDQEALDTVIPLVYNELKKLAAAHLRRAGKARPLDTTALVRGGRDFRIPAEYQDGAQIHVHSFATLPFGD